MSPMVYVDIKHHERKMELARAQELCEQRAWALIPYPILPLSLINHVVFVNIKHHKRKKRLCVCICICACEHSMLN